MSEPSKTELPPQMLKNAKRWAKISGKTLHVYWSPAMGRPMFAEGPPSDPKRFKVIAIISPDGTIKKMHGKRATSVATESQDPFDILVDMSRGAFAGYQGPLAEAKKPPQPTGKAQIALMTYLKKSHTAGGPMFPENELTDVVRHPMFRGMHFGKVSKAASVLAKKGLVKFNGLKISLVEDGSKHGQSMSSGFSRDAKLMAPGTRELVLKSRMTEIEAFAEDRGYDPAMVFAVAEVAMRMGRVPDLRQYGFAGEEAKAVRDFIAGDILNIAIEDVSLEQPLGCAYGSAGALPPELELAESAPMTWQPARHQIEEDWSEIEALCEATAMRSPSAAHVLANSLSGDLPEDRVHRNAAGPAMTETAYNILATPASAPTGSDADKMAKEIEKALAPLYKGRYLSVKAQDVFGQAKSIHIRAGNITPAMIKHNVAWHNDPYKFQAIVGGFLKDGSAGPKIDVEQIAGHYNKKRMRKKTIKPGKEHLMVQHIKKYVAGLMKDAPAPRAESIDETGQLVESRGTKIKAKVKFVYSAGAMPDIVMYLDGMHLPGSPRGWKLDPAHKTWLELVKRHKILKAVSKGKQKEVNTTVEFFQPSGDYKILVYIGGVMLRGYYLDPTFDAWKKLVAKYPKLGSVTEDLQEVSPPGWSGSVAAMKGEPAKKLKKYKDEPKSGDGKDITNPWALAWWMHQRGSKPHYKPEKGKPKYKAPKAESLSSAVAAFRELED